MVSGGHDIVFAQLCTRIVLRVENPLRVLVVGDETCTELIIWNHDFHSLLSEWKQNLLGSSGREYHLRRPQ